MKTITNEQFKIHCNDSILEYKGGETYNFYDLTDFYFNYNVGTNEFESSVQLSGSQILILGNTIIHFHKDRLKEENHNR